MYRRPKFLETLLEIRREMALEADYDVDLFVGHVRKGTAPVNGKLLTDVSPVSEPFDGAMDITKEKPRRKVKRG